MSNVFTAAGTTIAVSAAAPATLNAAGFAALTYTTIGEVTDIPEFGASRELVTHNAIDTIDTIKRKGSRNNGSVALNIASDEDDAGQALLEAGEADDASYSFKVTFQSGAIKYFTAQVMSFTTIIGSVNSIVSISAMLEIDSAIVKVAAA
jgi:hypothetical protein